MKRDDESDGEQNERAETRRLEELWTRFLARELLLPEERASLAAALERDEVFRRRMINDLQLHGMLRAAGELEQGQEKFIATVKALVTAAGRTEEVVVAVRRSLEAKAAARATRHPLRRTRSSRLAGTAILLASGLAAVLLLRMRPDPVGPPSEDSLSRGAADPSVPAPFARPAETTALPAPAAGARSPAAPAQASLAKLEGTTGVVYRQGPDGTRRAAVAAELSAGDWIWTSGSAGRASLSGPGGSRIELAGEAIAGLGLDSAHPGGVRLFLARGRASARMPARSGSAGLVLASPHAIVTGTGAVRLDVGAAVTRVEVKEGRAQVSALGVQQGTNVEAGQLALVSADDLQPPRAQTAPREALLLTGPDDTKESGPALDGLRPSEQRLLGRLEKLGFEVTPVDAATLLPERARAAALLVLSSSVSSQLLLPWFTELPVPMVVMESTGFEQLGLSGSRWRHDVGPTPQVSEMTIADPTHPLAAGFTGSVKVLTAAIGLRWAAPPTTAKVIGSFAGAPEQASLLFAYERGAATVQGTAPARRVCLFFGNGRVIRMLTEQGWKLFDAAALWAAAGN